jgi:mRNA interferase HigB
MNVSSEKVLWGFARKHPDAAKPLAIWRRLVQHGRFQNLVELKQTFGSVDMVPVKGHSFYVFNIGGNKYRLVATIHFQAQNVFVRHVLTHAEYSTDKWKNRQ